MKRTGYIAMQRLKSLKGQHVDLNTEDSDKTIRINSRTYTTEASIIGFQCKPRAGIALTHNIYGAEFEPGLNSGISGVSIIGIASRPQMKGTVAGAVTGEVICHETKLEGGSGRTITGPACVLRCFNELKSSPSGGVYIINVDTHGDVVPWSGLGKFPDDGQIAKTSDDKDTGTKGWIKVKIGTLTGYIDVGSLA
jgi:hypothetical protein